MVFLSDYDMQMAQEMVKGMDLWINTPRRPWEACGTSGMKVLANGGLNISELDGWWAEAYTPKVGWAIGDGKEHGEDAAWDAHEVESLYTLLEQQVVPEFYDRDVQGMPSRWLARVRESMATLTPEFSASRAIREYTNDHYLPAAAGYNARAANDGELGADLMQWRQSLARGWETLRFGKVSVETRDGQHRFQIAISTGSLRPEEFRVRTLCRPDRREWSRPRNPGCMQVLGGAVRHQRLFSLLPSASSGRGLHGTPRSIARWRFGPAGRLPDFLAAMRDINDGHGCPYPLGAILSMPGRLRSVAASSGTALPRYSIETSSATVLPKTCPKRPGQGVRLLSFGRRGAMARIADRFLQHGHGRRRSSPQLAFASSHEKRVRMLPVASAMLESAAP